MSAPVRIRLFRRAGWRMPENTVKVSRPSAFGNPFTIATAVESGYATAATAQAFVVECFRDWIGPSQSGRDWWQGEESDRRRGAILDGLPALRGKNLACWCALCPAHADGKPAGVVCAECAPCHADALLAMANSPTCTEVPS